MSTYRLWDRYMKCYDYLNRVDSYARNIEDIVWAVKARPHMDILDAGSGTGNLSVALKEKGARVVSLDYSVSALTKHLEKDPSAHIIRASLEERVPLDNARFDAVCCASVLFALSKGGCRMALSEFHRLLREDGRLTVTVAAPQKKNASLLATHLRALARQSSLPVAYARMAWDLPTIARIVHYNRQLQRQPDWNGYHRFTEEELRNLILDSGFDDVHIGTTYGNGFFLATARKRTRVVSIQISLPMRPAHLLGRPHGEALPAPHLRTAERRASEAAASKGEPTWSVAGPSAETSLHEARKVSKKPSPGINPIERTQSFMADLQSRKVERLRYWFREDSEVWVPPAGPVTGARRILALFRTIFRRYSDLNWTVTRFLPISDSTIVFQTTSWGRLGEERPYRNHVLTLLEFDGEGKIRHLSDYFKDTAVFSETMVAVAGD